MSFLARGRSIALSLVHWVVAPVVLIGLIGPAEAHPHIWITMQAELMSDAGGAFTGIRQRWTFDQAYSAYQTLNLDSRHDGQPDPDKLAELAKSDLASLVEFHYFTAAKANGAKVDFGAPTDPQLTFGNGRLTLTFVLPAKAPVKLPKLMSVEVNDPTFFVAFNLADGSDAVRLSGGLKACALDVHRPPKKADEGVQLIPDAVAGALAGKSTVGLDFANHIIVACP